MPWSRNTLWKQGSVLAKENFPTLGLANEIDADLVVAVSHDCDIANDNLVAEPAVEFIVARIVDEQNGNYALGKNPRTLHLDYRCEGEPIVVELIAASKISIPKDSLEALQPDLNYELGSTHILQSWLAARYRRHALPNSLVDRLREVFRYIDKVGKQNSNGILSFRLDYDPRKKELPPEEPYELSINIVYITDDESYAAKAEKIAKDLKDKFLQLIDKTKDFGSVDLQRCEAVSEMEFTARDMRETVEYHLEYLSHRTEPPGPIA
jgi:hypothetical protein